jgi:NADPH:quinone reductase-like Zn-dependent oxidoreductase
MNGKKLFSLVASDGTLRLYADDVDTGTPGADEVVIRIDAAPINPADLLTLLPGVDLTTLESSGTVDRAEVKATIPPERLADLAGRFGTPMGAGTEGAGQVVAAGPGAEHLIGKTVACMGRAMYAEYIRVPAVACFTLPDGVTAAQGASSIVNPVTALAILDTMRADGHSALAHTAAASNLGQMLNRICIDSDVPLVNIVRRREQADLLRSQGAQHVCVSSDADFLEQLVEAFDEARVSLAFDAVGGGPLIGQMLEAMETAALRHVAQYSRYGSLTRKTVYVYGALEDQPIQYQRKSDLMWTVSGWLLSLPPQRMKELWDQTSLKLTTTFMTKHAASLSLCELLTPSNLRLCAQHGTGQKLLIIPHKHSL